MIFKKNLICPALPVSQLFLADNYPIGLSENNYLFLKNNVRYFIVNLNFVPILGGTSGSCSGKTIRSQVLGSVCGEQSKHSISQNGATFVIDFSKTKNFGGLLYPYFSSVIGSSDLSSSTTSTGFIVGTAQFGSYGVLTFFSVNLGLAGGNVSVGELISDTVLSATSGSSGGIVTIVNVNPSVALGYKNITKAYFDTISCQFQLVDTPTNKSLIVTLPALAGTNRGKFTLYSGNPYDYFTINQYFQLN